MTLSEQSDETRSWYIVIEGGPWFAWNAAKALDAAADRKRPGPSHEVFRRLAKACYQAHDEYVAQTRGSSS